MPEYLGVDYASRSDDAFEAFRSAGVGFIVRYLCPPGYRKLLTTDEAKAISEAGFNIVSVWQDRANRPDWFTAERGAAEGVGALAAAQAAGQPPGTPIYAAVDFDAQEGHLPAIKAYLDAFQEGLKGVYHLGLYGGVRVIAAFAQEIYWLWQTYAWSGGRLHPSADLYQYHNGFQLGPAAVDLDRAFGNPGWWRIGGIVTPPPFKDPRGEVSKVPVLRIGSRGVEVALLQFLLNLAGAGPIARDGVFGGETEAAVKAFQTGAALDVDGVAGPQTWTALSRMQAPDSGRFGKTMAQVLTLQQEASAKLQEIEDVVMQAGHL